jgi:hypothetical protein
LITTTDGTKPRIKNNPANYRTRASLASAPIRDRESPSTSNDREHAFFTAPIDEAGYIRFDLAPSKDIE